MTEDKEVSSGPETVILPTWPICRIQSEVHRLAKEKGWWDRTRPIPELLCLIHSEVSEALEAYRERDAEGFKEELADVVIRVMDLAEAEGIDLATAIAVKHSINKRRLHRHGGKRC